eukprot:1190607-Prorocentrum_minimum.AAC.2
MAIVTAQESRKEVLISVLHLVFGCKVGLEFCFRVHLFLHPTTSKGQNHGRYGEKRWLGREQGRTLKGAH